MKYFKSAIKSDNNGIIFSGVKHEKILYIEKEMDHEKWQNGARSECCFNNKKEKKKEKKA